MRPRGNNRIQFLVEDPYQRGVRGDLSSALTVSCDIQSVKSLSLAFVVHNKPTHRLKQVSKRSLGGIIFINQFELAPPFCMATC